MIRTALFALGLPAAALADTATVNGLDIHYEVAGDLESDETPVLLLHGGLMSSDLTWSQIAPILAEDRPVIVIDQQARGRTGDRDAPMTLESMRADTLGVLDALGVEETHVVGYSIGGMLALELAVNAPDRVASVTAISASASEEGMLPEVAAIIANPDIEPSPDLMPLLPTEEDSAAMQESYSENPDGPEIMQTAFEKLGRLHSGAWGWSDEELSAVRAPVLLIIGEHDFIRPDHAEHMAETIPDARLEVIPGAKHMTVIDDAERIAQLINERIES